jgi:trigger factor
VFPEVQLGDFAGITVEKPKEEVVDNDLENMIVKLREQRLEYTETKRMARDEDKLNIDFEGFVDGEAFEGGKGEGSDIILGSGTMIPGFEKGLLKCKAGEEKDLELKFPDEYQAENLAGKEALFKIKVNTVSAPEKPELDDEFFKLFGVEEGGMEAFRTEVRGNMEKELATAIKNKVKNQVMDGLVETNSVDIPKALVASEVDRMRQEAVQQFGGAEQIDPSVLPAEMFEKQAEKRVKLSLVVSAIVEQFELKVDDEKVKETIEEMASTYEQPEQVVNYYYNNEQQLNQIQNMVLEQQVVDSILEKATVSEVNQPYEEAIKPPEPPMPDLETADEGDTDGGDEKEAS